MKKSDLILIAFGLFLLGFGLAINAFEQWQCREAERERQEFRRMCWELDAAEKRGEFNWDAPGNEGKWTRELYREYLAKRAR